MSEFSESFHLRATSRLEAVELLRRAGLAGYVFPALDGWVTLLPEGITFEDPDQLVAVNRGTLLRWAYGEDHGWGFNVYEGTEEKLSYFCSWEDDLEVDGEIQHSQLQQLLGLQLQDLAGPTGAQIFYPPSMTVVFETKPAYTFAKAIGLTHFKWLSYDYMQLDESRGQELPLGVLAVRGDA